MIRLGQALLLVVWLVCWLAVWVTAWPEVEGWEWILERNSAEPVAYVERSISHVGST